MFQKIKKISKLRGYGLFTNYHKSLHNFITKKISLQHHSSLVLVSHSSMCNHKTQHKLCLKSKHW